jgi:tetratricopeptide (TPR) repeat protein
MEGSVPGRNGSVIGFYGWKGGAGRTLLLANLAVGLALEGKHVLAIDLDLEAPGLGDYFDRFVSGGTWQNQDFLKDGGWRNRPGFLDLVRGVAGGAQPDGLVKSFMHKPAVLGRATRASSSSPGSLHYLGTEERPGSERYAYRMLQADWDRYFAAKGGRAIDQLLPELRSRFDAILVDLRTGLSQFTFQIYVRMIDKLVIVTAPTHQGARGISTAADVFAYNNPETPKFFVLSDLHLDLSVQAPLRGEESGANPPTAGTQPNAPERTPGGDVQGAGSKLATEEATAEPLIDLGGSAEAVITLALHRLLVAEKKEPGSSAQDIRVADRLFRLPRLPTQQGTEALLYQLPPVQTDDKGDARRTYCDEGNRLARALLPDNVTAFDPDKLWTPGNREEFNRSRKGNSSTPGIVKAIVKHAIGAIEAFKGVGQRPTLQGPGNAAEQKGGKATQLGLALANGPYQAAEGEELPFGVRPLLGARLAQPYLSFAHYEYERNPRGGDPDARSALEGLGLDLLEEADIEPIHKANERFAASIFGRRGNENILPSLVQASGGTDPNSATAGEQNDATETVGQETTTHQHSPVETKPQATTTGSATDTKPTIAPEELNQILLKAATDARHPWRALASLSEPLKGKDVPETYQHRVAEVLISLFSNAEDHLSALEELLSLPPRAEDRATLRALEEQESYAAQLYRAIQGAFGSCLDSMAVGARDDKALGTIANGVQRLSELNLGRSYPAIIGRYRKGLAALGIGSTNPVATATEDAENAGQKTRFDAFVDEALLGAPPADLRNIEINLKKLDPGQRAFVHSARGEPALALGARQLAVQQARRPNEPVSGNPRQVTALRDVGVMAARAGAVDQAMTMFNDLLDAIPDLYAEGRMRDDSWVEEDIQHERRLLLLYRAHCHWMAGDLEKAKTDLVDARDAHKRYREAHIQEAHIQEAHSDDPTWAIRPLPAFHVLLEARLAYDSGNFCEALNASEPLVQIYRAQVPIDGVPAIERLAGLHRLRARAYRSLKNYDKASLELVASLEAANRAPAGNPGPDADRAEAELLQLCWGQDPNEVDLEEAFKKASEAINNMIEFELPDGLLDGPHQSSFQARAVTLAIDCMKANSACKLHREAERLIEGMKEVDILEPLCKRLRKQLSQCAPTTGATGS